MAALAAGTQAPEISLPTMNGNPPFSLAAARKRGPVLAAFFKVSCPVCQFAFPYIQRIFANYGAQKVSIVGISQDSAGDTERFARQHGITFPLALDEQKKFPVSNAYGLTNVPSLFWIAPDGRIVMNSVGWSKAEMEKLNQEVAAANGVASKPIFQPGENVPEFRPG
jgi:peroxiredoxin